MTDYKMTDEDKKLVFEYMRWPVINTKGIGFIEAHNRGAFNHPLDAIDMVAAMNKMVEMGDWPEFYDLSFEKWEDEGWEDDVEEYLKNEGDSAFVCRWLMQPARFFELMGNWLKEKENEKSE